MKLFLIVYDRQIGRILSLREYGPDERAKALQDRSTRELAEKDHKEIEVVVLGADSLDALKKTHRRYFETVEQIAKPVAG